MSDMVNHPSHYTQGNIECIDAIASALGDEGMQAFCRGNALKYLWRAPYKGGKEDLEKARWYIDHCLTTETKPTSPEPSSSSCEPTAGSSNESKAGLLAAASQTSTASRRKK